VQGLRELVKDLQEAKEVAEAEFIRQVSVEYCRVHTVPEVAQDPIYFICSLFLHTPSSLYTDDCRYRGYRGLVVPQREATFHTVWSRALVILAPLLVRESHKCGALYTRLWLLPLHPCLRYVRALEV
jgi:hypothetical protein